MALAAHQCLAKPCRTDVLTSVLRGALIPSLAVKVRGLLEGIYTRLLQAAAWTRLGVREVPTTAGEAYHQARRPGGDDRARLGVATPAGERPAHGVPGRRVAALRTQGAGGPRYRQR